MPAIFYQKNIFYNVVYKTAGFIVQYKKQIPNSEGG